MGNMESNHSLEVQIVCILYIMISPSFLFVFIFFYRPGRKKDFTPLLWSQYFETMEDVEVENENGKDISFPKSLFHKNAVTIFCCFDLRISWN